MNEKIIQMASEAGFSGFNDLPTAFQIKMERFAAAIRAATKDEDAKICEDLKGSVWVSIESANECADAIRASK